MSNIEVSVKDKVGNELVVDDIVKGVNNCYGITNSHMTRGRILHIREDEIEVRIMKHDVGGYAGDTFGSMQSTLKRLVISSHLCEKKFWKTSPKSRLKIY